jgi:hypothetical protein
MSGGPEYEYRPHCPLVRAINLVSEEMLAFVAEEGAASSALDFFSHLLNPLWHRSIQQIFRVVVQQVNVHPVIRSCAGYQWT